MLRGMATVNYYADDLEAAKDWYSELLGVAPYFAVPGGYYEFRIGDYQAELGIINKKFAPSHPDRPGGQIVNWHVDDVAATFRRLLDLGRPNSSRSSNAVRGPGSRPPRWWIRSAMCSASCPTRITWRSSRRAAPNRSARAGSGGSGDYPAEPEGSRPPKEPVPVFDGGAFRV
ncbi:glyoxalase [Nocardia seriolae]|uniref:Glyoxalase n=1 Tax=Nocardia seriolae TaxID=37332 RepID=A0ABC9YX47_9NOCA|nr:hypothetical protein NSER024013_25790 [Nocardia seriolae]GAM47917.1 glyoxalase [Nocardia seriolae]GAP29781.1 glyoxalase [Nocardia seriolae]